VRVRHAQQELCDRSERVSASTRKILWGGHGSAARTKAEAVDGNNFFLECPFNWG